MIYWIVSIRNMVNYFRVDTQKGNCTAFLDTEIFSLNIILKQLYIVSQFFGAYTKKLSFIPKECKTNRASTTLVKNLSIFHHNLHEQFTSLRQSLKSNEYPVKLIRVWIHNLLMRTNSIYHYINKLNVMNI